MHVCVHMCVRVCVCLCVSVSVCVYVSLLSCILCVLQPVPPWKWTDGLRYFLSSTALGQHWSHITGIPHFQSGKSFKISPALWQNGASWTLQSQTVISWQGSGSLCPVLTGQFLFFCTEYLLIEMGARSSSWECPK